MPLLCQTHTAATNRKQPEGHSSVYGIPSLRRYGRQAGDKRQSRRQKGEKDDSRHAPVAKRASRQALSAILTSGLFPAGRKRRNDHPTTAYLRFARSGERHPSRACARVLTVQTCPKAADLCRRNKAPVGSDRMANTETDRCAASQRAVVGGGTVGHHLYHLRPRRPGRPNQRWIADVTVRGAAKGQPCAAVAMLLDLRPLKPAADRGPHRLRSAASRDAAGRQRDPDKAAKPWKKSQGCLSHRAAVAKRASRHEISPILTQRQLLAQEKTQLQPVDVDFSRRPLMASRFEPLTLREGLAFR